MIIDPTALEAAAAATAAVQAPSEIYSLPNFNS
jgi:hypothetical protein